MNESEVGEMHEAMRIREKGKRRPRKLRSSSGAQLVEFAFTLPFLLLLLVGIWDLGSGFLLKQKLTNAAREAARAMISTPYKPLYGATGCSTSTTPPCSVVAAATTAQQYLSNADLDSSWINPSSPSSSTGCEWTYTSGTSASGSGPAYELDIKGGVMVEPDGTVLPYGTAAPVGSTSSTQVTVTWPLSWFASSLLPASSLPKELSTTITMANIGGGCTL